MWNLDQIFKNTENTKKKKKKENDMMRLRNCGENNLKGSHWLDKLRLLERKKNIYVVSGYLNIIESIYINMVYIYTWI